jgi:hypothetical protein
MSNYKEIKVISPNEHGVIWVENEVGMVFGIASATQMIDEDGIPFQDDIFTVIDNNFDCELEQDWDNEATFIYTTCHGVIRFKAGHVEFGEFDYYDGCFIAK